MPSKIVLKKEYREIDPIKILGKSSITHEALNLKDTTKLQMASLNAFAESVGFYFVEKDGRFINLTSHKYVYVSFERMVRWHNSCFNSESERWYWHGHNRLDIDKFAKYGIEHMSYIRFAIQSKLVSVVKLQLNKKTKEVIVVDHQVRFA